MQIWTLKLSNFRIPKIHALQSFTYCRRSIVPGYGSPTERKSALVYDTLQPIVITYGNCPSYISDSSDSLKNGYVGNSLMEDVIIVSIDVSLYANIHQDQGKEPVKSTYIVGQQTPS